MFVPYRFQSVNRPSDLPVGRYRTEASFYSGGAAQLRVTLLEYTLDGETLPRAVDLVVFDSRNAVRVRDFVLLADSSWRDSAGERSNLLEELVDPLVAELTLLDRIQLVDQDVRDEV